MEEKQASRSAIIASFALAMALVCSGCAGVAQGVQGFSDGLKRAAGSVTGVSRPALPEIDPAQAYNVFRAGNLNFSAFPSWDPDGTAYIVVTDATRQDASLPFENSVEVKQSGGVMRSVTVHGFLSLGDVSEPYSLEFSVVEKGGEPTLSFRRYALTGNIRGAFRDSFSLNETSPEVVAAARMAVQAISSLSKLQETIWNNSEANSGKATQPRLVNLALDGRGISDAQTAFLFSDARGSSLVCEDKTGITLETQLRHPLSNEHFALFTQKLDKRNAASFESLVLDLMKAEEFRTLDGWSYTEKSNFAERIVLASLVRAAKACAHPDPIGELLEDGRISVAGFRVSATGAKNLEWDRARVESFIGKELPYLLKKAPEGFFYSLANLDLSIPKTGYEEKGLQINEKNPTKGKNGKTLAGTPRPRTLPGDRAMRAKSRTFPHA